MWWVLLAVIVAVAIYFSADKVREWVNTTVRAVWFRWFRDSETNLFADLLWAVGLLDVVLADPQLAALLAQAGVESKWLIISGLVIRLLRGVRDKAMLPLTKYEP